MIDLHSHILPGLDDGPPNLEGSLELARIYAAVGVTRIAATPHIREDYPFDPAEVSARVHELNRSLRHAAIPIEILPAGEVALTKAPDLSDEILESLCLGNGRYLLVESPYTPASEMLERDLFNLQVRGFVPMLAHPERAPSFQTDRDRLATLVERGVLCSVTAASMTGHFGKRVMRFTVDLFSSGLVHDVASDTHGARSRVPDLEAGFRALAAELPGLMEQTHWYTRDAPAAILAGDALPPKPESPGRARGWRLWRRV